MTPLKSSNLHGIRQDGDDLLVTFKGKDGPGASYRYRGAGSHHDDLAAADSPGAYFHRNVKGCHDCEPCSEE